MLEVIALLLYTLLILKSSQYFYKIFKKCDKVQRWSSHGRTNRTGSAGPVWIRGEPLSRDRQTANKNVINMTQIVIKMTQNVINVLTRILQCKICTYILFNKLPWIKKQNSLIKINTKTKGNSFFLSWLSQVSHIHSAGYSPPTLWHRLLTQQSHMTFSASLSLTLSTADRWNLCAFYDKSMKLRAHITHI